MNDFCLRITLLNFGLGPRWTSAASPRWAGLGGGALALVEHQVDAGRNRSVGSAIDTQPNRSDTFPGEIERVGQWGLIESLHAIAAIRRLRIDSIGKHAKAEPSGKSQNFPQWSRR